METTQRGFTLIELMAALTVLSILMGIAIPSFRQFSANSQTVATTNSLASALAVARSEALRRSMPVSVCSSSDSKTCAASLDWHNGWIVFTDNGVAGVLDGTDELVQAWPAPGGDMSVLGSRRFVQYDPRGMRAPGSAAVTLTTWHAGCVGQNRTVIAVTVAGSPQNTHTACP